MAKLISSYINVENSCATGLLFFLHLFEIEILCNLLSLLTLLLKWMHPFWINELISFQKNDHNFKQQYIKYTWILCFYFILGIVVYICNISLLLVISHNKITSA